jgi:hypothetical protein
LGFIGGRKAALFSRLPASLLGDVLLLALAWYVFNSHQIAARFCSWPWVNLPSSDNSGFLKQVQSTAQLSPKLFKVSCIAAA